MVPGEFPLQLTGPTTMNRLLSGGLLIVGVALLAVGAFQAIDWWRQPRIANVAFDVSMPGDLRPGGVEYPLSLTIRNKNDRPITIYGEYTC